MSKLSILRGVNTMPLQALLERPVAYHRSFVALGAGITGALMLSQAVYWSSRTNDKDGWFYKSQAEWEEETGLTRYEQEGARKKLVKLGFMEERKQGVPCKLFFRICMEAISASLVAENQQSSMRKTNKLECGEPTGSDAENPQPITENTTESTSSSSPGAEAVTDHSEQIEDIFAGRHYRPMTIGWKPIEKSMKVYAFKQGVSMALLTGDVLAAFQCHWSAHPEVEDTAEGWTNRLVKWAKAERVRSELAPSAKTDDLPCDEIVDAYHKACPRLAPVTLIDNKLKSLIAERWEEHEAHQDISFWSDYFAAAGRLAEVFYRGKKRKPYCEAMLCRDVFRDVMEGRENA